MLFKYCHYFFDTLIADALDLTKVFLDLTQVDGLAVLTGASIGADVYRLIDAGIFVIFGIFSSLVLANDPLQNDHLENRTPVCLLPHRYGQFSVQTPLH